MYPGTVPMWQVECLAPFISTIPTQGAVLAEAAWRNDDTRSALIAEAGRKPGSPPTRANAAHIPAPVRGSLTDVCDAVRHAAQINLFSGGGSAEGDS